MLKKAKPIVNLIVAALTYALSGLVYAEEIEKTSSIIKKMTIREMGAYKMWLLHQGLAQAEIKEDLPAVPKDVRWVIGGMLHYLMRNPVLNWNLIYTRSSDNKQFTFKITDLVKEGKLDLSLPEFADVEKHLLITLEPANFFQNKPENKDKTLMLIAPRSLIEEQLAFLPKEFAPIMASWKEDTAPIGIFWRWGQWIELSCFHYLTKFSTDQLFLKNLFSLHFNSLLTHTPQSIQCGYDSSSISALIAFRLSYSA